jgi:hypothetical protein
MDERSFALVAVVCALSIVAVVLVAASSKGRAGERDRRFRLKDAERALKGVDSGGRVSCVSQRADDERRDEEARRSPLLIPPADEARIEAVAPRNDITRKV